MMNIILYYCIPFNFTGRYDYDPGPYKVTFRAGNRRATVFP